MRHQSWMAVGVCTMLLAVAALPARAQSNPPDHPAVTEAPTVSVTPFLSLGSTMSSRAGAVVTFPLTQSTSVEAEVGYRKAEIGAVSAYVSLVQDMPRIGRITPYLAAGLGLEQYGAPIAA